MSEVNNDGCVGSHLINKYVLVRTYTAGVHFGVLKFRNGRDVTLLKGRRIWSWSGANTLHEIANSGVNSESKISEEVSLIELTEAVEIIAVSPLAVKVLSSIGWGL